MATDLDRLTRQFCRTLYNYAGGLPFAWRSILMASNAAAIRAASTQKMVVEHGVSKGWLVAKDGRDVALTDEGRALGEALERNYVRRRDRAKETETNDRETKLASNRG